MNEYKQSPSGVTPKHNVLNILFIIRSLDTGGAERQLLTLARGLTERGHRVTIAVMYSGGALEHEVPEGVQLVRLNKKSRWDLIGFFTRARNAVQKLKPDVIHGYMTGANEIALFLGKSQKVPVVWGIRVSDQSFENYSTFRRTIFELSRVLSRYADLVIANSDAGRRFHEAVGYPADKVMVIHNGIDTIRFAPNPKEGARWREVNSVQPNEPLVVLLARIDPMKDHDTFLRAVVCFRKTTPDARFVAVGGGADDRRRLEEKIAALGLGGVVQCLPPQSDVAAMYSAADVITLTSKFGEGFPNVLGEAMACGTPCVATSAGDSAVVLGREGRCVPVGDAEGVAQGWRAFLSEDSGEKLRRSGASRSRIVEHFSVTALVDKTERALRSISRNSAEHS